MINREPTQPCLCHDGQACEIHDDMDPKELKMRRKMVQAAIKEVQGAGDPFGVLPEYRHQAQNIDAALRKRRDISKKPPPTSIALKPGSLGAEILKPGG